jgi:hypothetical protein
MEEIDFWKYGRSFSLNDLYELFFIILDLLIFFSKLLYYKNPSFLDGNWREKKECPQFMGLLQWDGVEIINWFISAKLWND